MSSKLLNGVDILVGLVGKGPMASYVALVQFTIRQFESPLLNMKLHPSAVNWRIGSARGTKELYHSAVFTDATNSTSCHPRIY